MRNFVIFLVNGWAGFFVMALELLAGRMISAYFGSTVNVWAGVICIFLLALAMGYITGGALSRMNHTIRMLGVFLFAAAAGVILTYAQGGNLLYWAFNVTLQKSIDPGYGAMLAALVIYTLPTYLLGMVSPYATRLLVTNKQSSGAAAGWLYFTGAIGSAVGTILTSFYLVRWFAQENILLALIIISTFIGLFTFFIASGEDGY